jgi:hypothetical protein
MGGKLTVFTLRKNAPSPSPRTGKHLPFSHDWQTVIVDLGGTIPVRVILATV